MSVAFTEGQEIDTFNDKQSQTAEDNIRSLTAVARATGNAWTSGGTDLHEVRQRGFERAHAGDREVQRLVERALGRRLAVRALRRAALREHAHAERALERGEVPRVRLSLEPLEDALEELARVVLKLDRLRKISRQHQQENDNGRKRGGGNGGEQHLVHSDVAARLHEVDPIEARQLRVLQKVHRALHLPQHVPVWHLWRLLARRARPCAAHPAALRVPRILERARAACLWEKGRDVSS